MSIATASASDVQLQTALPSTHDEPIGILIVDDQDANLLVLETLLQGLGEKLLRARSGPEALRLLLKHEVGVILMDVHMPGMDGLETAALIRGRDQTCHTPIIFVTAHDGTANLFRGYELGAIDYLIKPIIPDVLQSKVKALVDLHRMTRRVQLQAEQIREMERRQHERELAEMRQRCETERLREEARLAKEIQERLFPVARMPMPGFDIAGASFPAEATGGDYFDYIPLPDESIGIVIGDVSGHGYGPALLMAEIRAYLRALCLTRADIGDIIGLMNRALYEDTHEDRFATLLLGRLDTVRRTFTYTSAGHPTGYILDATGAVKRRLLSTGMPLAVLPDETFPAAVPVVLEDGDTVVLVTDGILEAQCDDGSLFGIDRLLSVVRSKRRETARDIVDAIFDAARVGCRTRQPDDMTMIVIKVEGSRLD